jgi:signal transduction histidine kinase
VVDAASRVEQGLARGVAVFRWLSIGWAAVGLWLEREHLEHPRAAVVGVAAAISFSAVLTWSLTTGRRVLRPQLVLVELALGAGLLVLDGVVFSAARQQSLPWSWPAAGIISAAVGFGLWWGLAAATTTAAASFVGESMLRDGAAVTTAALSKSALYFLAAAAAASVARRLYEAERQISAARARDEVARVLHDGVLQTLAVVQRRSEDEGLRALARDQERELRGFLFGERQSFRGAAAALRATVDQVVHRHQASADVDVLIASDFPSLTEHSSGALAGAVGEAVTNALKHSAATHVTVLAEPDEDGDHRVVVVVRDDGCGFDTTAVVAGVGLCQSIRARIEAAGGVARVSSAPGKGTEVWLWIS